MANVVSDVIIVGGGIIGLAHAYGFARQGLKVCLLERNSRANDASIRNFGFVTVSGQREGVYWQHSKKTAELWKDIVKKADISVYQKGSLVTAQRPESLAVLEEFTQGYMGEECSLLTKQEVLKRCAHINEKCLVGAMYSPYEIRINPQEALEKLYIWLQDWKNITIYRGTQALRIEEGAVVTKHSTFTARCVVSCPGGDIVNIFPEVSKTLGILQTKLQMLEVQTKVRKVLPYALMSDASMIFYKGFSCQPSADTLRATIQREYPDVVENGINTIVVQQKDGNLVIGDSHAYLEYQDPFYHTHVEETIIEQISKIVSLEGATVKRRWVGFYPCCHREDTTFRKVSDKVYLATVNRGKGMSICWSWAEKNVKKILESM